MRMAYSLRSFLSKRLVFRDVLLANAELVLDQPPGEDWNFVRIFPQDTTAVDTARGFGSWVRLEDVTVRNSNAYVRMAWEPADSLPAQQRDSAIQAALSGDSRPDIVALISQQWEEVHYFENQGAGRFTATRLWGSTNEDYGSSGLTVSDLNRDGRPDVIFTNGDGFGNAQFGLLCLQALEFTLQLVVRPGDGLHRAIFFGQRERERPLLGRFDVFHPSGLGAFGGNLPAIAERSHTCALFLVFFA